MNRKKNNKAVHRSNSLQKKENLKRKGYVLKVYPLRLIHILSVYIIFISVNSVLANPQEGNVTSGNAIITQAPDFTHIQQTSSKAIIDWKSFNIGSQEHVHFQQPNGGVTLNRVNPTHGVSQIFGHLTATGKIILINQAGIYFGPTAHVNVGGIIASSIDMTNENFLAGKYLFNQSSLYNGAVINDGKINAAEHGLVALLGPGVENNGLIEARSSTVILASGTKFTVDFYGDGLISFEVTEATTSSAIQEGRKLKHGVNNTGTIIADGGHILMTAKSVQNVMDNLINMEGVAQAKSIAQKNGEVILLGDNEGIVKVAGKIDVSGKEQGQSGGVVHITSKYVHIAAPTTIDVSGDNGAGEILIGGDYQGKGLLPNASKTLIEPSTTLLADAITNGDGGKIIIWSDDATAAYGKISAKGGELSGNGGFVETSGHGLDVNSLQVDLRAPQGTTGTWLLDPTDVTINNDLTLLMSFNGTTKTYSPLNLIILNSTLNAGDLGTQLATANIRVVTTNPLGSGNGDITVDGVTNLDTNWTSAANTSLTLQADRDIIINTAITLSGTGKSVILNPANGRNITINGDLNGSFTLNMAATSGSLGTVTINNAIGNTTPLNSVTVNNGSSLLLNANITTTGSQTYNPVTTVGIATTTLTGGNISINGNISDGGNNRTLVINTSGSSSISGIVSQTTAIAKQGNGTLNLSGNNTYTGLTTISAGTLQASHANALGSVATGTSVASDATLEINGVAIGAEGLTLNGVGVGSNGALLGTGTSSLVGNVTLASDSTIGGTGTLTLSGIISASGSQALTKVGAGTLILSGANTYTGATTINAGTLRLGASGVIADTSAVTLANVVDAIFDLNHFSEIIGSLFGGGVTGGNITLGAGTLTVTQTSDGNYAGVISGTGGFTKIGANTLTLSGANTYIGATTINAGVLSANTLANGGIASSIGASTNAAVNLVLGGGTLQYTGGTISIDRNFILTNATTNTIDVSTGATTLTISGASTGTTGALTKIGDGTLTLSGANSYSGLTTIGAGTLIAAHATALGTTASGTSVTNGATLEINGVAIGAEALTLNGVGVGSNGALLGTGTSSLSGNVALTSNSTISSTGTLTLSGIISGTDLIKEGSGILILSGENTYTGETIINEGTLRITNADGLGATSQSNVISGATMDLAFNNNTLGNSNEIILNGNGYNNEGALIGSGTNITLDNTITLDSDSLIHSIGQMMLNGLINGNYNLAIDFENTGVILPTITLMNGGSLTINANGTISQIGEITAESLTATAVGGITLNNANSINYFAAENNVSGNITLTNIADTLFVNNINQNSNGDISITNTGALTTTGTIQTMGGNVSLTTLSPDNLVRLLSINGNIITSGGSITANAANPNNASTAIIINGLLNTTGGVGQGVLTIGQAVEINQSPLIGSGNITLQNSSSLIANDQTINNVNSQIYITNQNLNTTNTTNLYSINSAIQPELTLNTNEKYITATDLGITNNFELNSATSTELKFTKNMINTIDAVISRLPFASLKSNIETDWMIAELIALFLMIKLGIKYLKTRFINPGKNVIPNIISIKMEIKNRAQNILMGTFNIPIHEDRYNVIPHTTAINDINFRIMKNQISPENSIVITSNNFNLYNKISARLNFLNLINHSHKFSYEGNDTYFYKYIYIPYSSPTSNSLLKSDFWGNDTTAHLSKPQKIISD